MVPRWMVAVSFSIVELCIYTIYIWKKKPRITVGITQLTSLGISIFIYEIDKFPIYHMSWGIWFKLVFLWYHVADYSAQRVKYIYFILLGCFSHLFKHSWKF